ncbi:MAG: tetratricopeptide repeat protein [Tepidisphaeraceae bacterium]|jgi:tetratricopeptide (TPR) repeat protein
MKQASKNVRITREPLPPGWKVRAAGAAVIIVLTAIAYFPALQGKFVWDDDSWTTGIPQLIGNLHGLRTMWLSTELQQYYPLAGTTFWIDYQLWGFWPLPYHVENILLHTSSALLFWALLRRLKVPGAWLAGALFALHPVMVESVAWITERKNVSSMVLYLGSLLAYGRFNSFWSEGKNAGPRRWGAYALAFVLFTGAMLCKTTAFSLPAVILLIYWWKHGRIRWGDIGPTVPLFVVAIGFCITTAWLEKNKLGAKGPEWDISFPQRCLIAGRVVWFYAGKLLWPLNLCFLYPRWQLNSGSWRQWVFPISAVGVLLALWLARRRIGRGPLAAALFFVGTLLPVLGFMNAYFMRYSFVCDHWTYLSSLGLIALAAAGVTRLAGRLRAPGLPYGFAAVVLPAFAVLTWRQCGVYKDLQTLWLDTIAKNPGAWLAHNNLGVVYTDQGKIPQAVAEYEETLRLNPDYPQAHNNLGCSLAQMGRYEEAIAHYQHALRSYPDFPQAHFNWGTALEAEGRHAEAIAQFQQALQLKPDLADAHNALGTILMHQGKIQEAAAHFEEAVDIEPDSVVARDNLALALARQGKIDDAIVQWKQALRIQPGDVNAHYNWGLALQQAGRDEDAIEQYEEALAIDPDFFIAHYNLGGILMRLGRLPQAIEHFSDAAKIMPNSAEAHNQLALALWQEGQAAPAIAQWNLAVQFKPDYPEADNGLAWLLATLAPSEGGNPDRAVTLAKHACDLTGNQVPGYVDTLATAYAADGRFNDAIRTAQKAIALAQSGGQTQLVNEIQGRLKLYQNGRAFSPAAAPQTRPH